MALLGVTGDPDVIAPPHTGKLLPDGYSSYHPIFSAFCCSINPVYVIPVFAALNIEIENVEEETFLLFSQSLPFQDLGFVDSKATSLNINVAGKDLTII